jgi:hypothetical protein
VNWEVAQKLSKVTEKNEVQILARTTLFKGELLQSQIV